MTKMMLSPATHYGVEISMVTDSMVQLKMIAQPFGEVQLRIVLDVSIVMVTDGLTQMSIGV